LSHDLIYSGEFKLSHPLNSKTVPTTVDH
jgi:hypothetical protein